MLRKVTNVQRTVTDYDHVLIEIAVRVGLGTILNENHDAYD
jgi:hypothetical protein